MRPDTEVALVVSSYLEARYPFTHPRDASVVFDVCRQAYVAAREADGLPSDCRLYVLPSTKQLTAPTWRRFVEPAEGGATVYASYFVGEHDSQRGPWWPDLDATFGVRKRLRYGLVDRIVDDELRVRFRVPFGDIAAGEELVFAGAGTANSRAYLPVDPWTPRCSPRTRTVAPCCCAGASGAGRSCCARTPSSTWPRSPRR